MVKVPPNTDDNDDCAGVCNGIYSSFISRSVASIIGTFECNRKNDDGADGKTSGLGLSDKVDKGLVCPVVIVVSGISTDGNLFIEGIDKKS